MVALETDRLHAMPRPSVDVVHNGNMVWLLIVGGGNLRVEVSLRFEITLKIAFALVDQIPVDSVFLIDGHLAADGAFPQMRAFHFDRNSWPEIHVNGESGPVRLRIVIGRDESDGRGQMFLAAQVGTDVVE